MATSARTSCERWRTPPAGGSSTSIRSLTRISPARSPFWMAAVARSAAACAARSALVLAPDRTACSPRRPPPARGKAPAPRRTAARTAGLAAPSRSSRGAARRRPARRPAARRTSARSRAGPRDTPRRAARPRPAAPGTAAGAHGERSRRHPGVRVAANSPDGETARSWSKARQGPLNSRHESCCSFRRSRTNSILLFNTDLQPGSAVPLPDAAVLASPPRRRTTR